MSFQCRDIINEGSFGQGLRNMSDSHSGTHHSSFDISYHSHSN